jgi:hypothetical protein
MLMLNGIYQLEAFTKYIKACFLSILPRSEAELEHEKMQSAIC